MPIFRYFVVVGGALLALLFVAGFALPKAPAIEAIASTGSDLPLIRIRSDRRLPERVVLDTSQPTITPPAKVAEVAAPQPPAPAAAAAALDEMTGKARVRETFAQLVPSKHDAVKKAQPKRRVARARSVPRFGPPMMMVAQQPHFGLFNMTW